MLKKLCPTLNNRGQINWNISVRVISFILNNKATFNKPIDAHKSTSFISHKHSSTYVLDLERAYSTIPISNIIAYSLAASKGKDPKRKGMRKKLKNIKYPASIKTIRKGQVEARIMKASHN